MNGTNTPVQHDCSQTSACRSFLVMIPIVRTAESAAYLPVPRVWSVFSPTVVPPCASLLRRRPGIEESTPLGEGTAFPGRPALFTNNQLQILTLAPRDVYIPSDMYAPSDMYTPCDMTRPLMPRIKRKSQRGHTCRRVDSPSANELRLPRLSVSANFQVSSWK